MGPPTLQDWMDWMGPPTLRYQGNVDGPFRPLTSQGTSDSHVDGRTGSPRLRFFSQRNDNILKRGAKGANDFGTIHIDADSFQRFWSRN